MGLRDGSDLEIEESEMSAIGLMVVGDEILSGKRQDRHFSKVIDLLRLRGRELAWAHFIGDDDHAIAAEFAAARQRKDIVLSCGGIGATPDDRTRQAAALAYGVPIVRHPEAEALIVAEYGERAFPNRVLMADFPAGAELIPNPINRVAGFSIESLYCVPGFPEMAWPMLEWVLDGPLSHLHMATPSQEFRLRAIGTSGEGDLLGLMEAVLDTYPGVKLSSLPFRGDDSRPRHIEFGIRGPEAVAAAAFTWFRARLVEDHADLRIEDLQIPLVA
jgi:molybdopterin-biosynthesis enzyme MoeA-like protein